MKRLDQNNFIGTKDEDNFKEIKNNATLLEVADNKAKTFNEGKFLSQIRKSYKNGEEFILGIKAEKETNSESDPGFAASISSIAITIYYDESSSGGSGPSAPKLLSPNDNQSVELAKSIGFSWKEPSEPTGTYSIQIDDQVDFSSPEYTEHTILDTQGSDIQNLDINLSEELNRDNTYYWRVRGYNEATGEWSSVRSFNVKPLSLEVNITGPNTLNSGETGTWSADVSHNEGSVSYQWYIRHSGGSSWYSWGSGSSMSNYFTNNDTFNKVAGVKVQVNSTGETATDAIDVTIYGGGDDCYSLTTASNDSVQAYKPPPGGC